MNPGLQAEVERLRSELERAERERAVTLREHDRQRGALLSMLEDLERDRRRVEQGRREWMVAMDAIADCIFLHDRECRIVRANRAYAARAGLDIRAVIGRVYWELFPRLSGPPDGCRRAQAEGGPTEEELRLPGGEEFVSRSFPILDADGRYAYSLHLLTDVTAARRAAAEQRVQSEALRQASEAVVVLDPEGLITYVNPAFRQLLGYDPAEIHNHPVTELSVPQQDASRQPSGVLDRLRRDGQWRGEVRRRARDGTAVPILLSATAMRDAAGAVTGYVGTYLDLRDIKRAEEGLRQSEQRFRSLVEHSSDVITLFGIDGSIRFISGSVATVLGYAPGELEGQTVFDLVHPDDRLRVRAVFDAALAHPGRVYNVEARLRGKDGGYIETETVGRNLLGDPSVGGMVTNTRDISDRRRAEAALRDSEERFRAISTVAQDAILMMDDEGRIEYWNPAAERIFGYPADAALARELHELIVPERYRADFRRGFGHFRATGEGAVVGRVLELAARHRDGHEFPVELGVSALKRGDHWHAVGLLRDITDRKRAESDLHQSEQNLKTIFDGARDGMLVADAETRRFVASNATVQRMLGYSAEELGTLGVEDIHPPDKLANVLEQFGRQARGEITLAPELPVRRKDGSVFYADVNASPLVIGGRECMLGMFRDVTDRRLAEEHVRRLNRTLGLLSTCNGLLVRESDEQRLVQNVCRLIVERGGYRQSWVGYAERDPERRIRIVSQCGEKDAAALTSLDLRWTDDERGRHPSAQVLRSGAAVMVPDVFLEPSLAAWHDVFRARGVAALVVLPLKAKDEMLGVLNIFADRVGAFDADEIQLLNELSDDLAFGIYTLRARAAHDHLQQEHLKSGERLKEALTGTIRAIALTVEKRDPYTAGHMNRVADLATAIGRELGLAEECIEGLRLGATIHDIGKIYVPAEILNRPGRLTAAEFDIIKSHSQVGYEIVKDVAFPWPVADMILQHHERVDGSGYPAGLAGEQIILEARILAVADVVEAITSHRPYRPSRGTAAALAEIEAGRGSRYDSAVADACLRLAREQRFSFDALRAVSS